LTIGLREGKNREVRNVLGALGLEVNRLIRVSYGPFQLGDVESGQAREIRGRVLREQLGEKLIEASGADFETPSRENVSPRTSGAKKPFPRKPDTRGDGQLRPAGGGRSKDAAKRGQVTRETQDGLDTRRRTAARKFDDKRFGDKKFAGKPVGKSSGSPSGKLGGKPGGKGGARPSSGRQGGGRSGAGRSSGGRPTAGKPKA
ncbi:MAG: RNA pseudouridine synthase, partial [Pseudomonadota bacterium]